VPSSGRLSVASIKVKDNEKPFKNTKISAELNQRLEKELVKTRYLNS
jgi:hypothetical protein